MTPSPTHNTAPAAPAAQSSYHRGLTLRARPHWIHGWGHPTARVLTAPLPVSRTFEFDAVIFDMDGVITDTASVHAAAWKQAFDTYLQGWAQASGRPFVEFSRADYLAYVDGRPRYKGVQAFLHSRGIDLAFGSPTDAPGRDTVCGLGNQKNSLFNRLLEDGVRVFDSSVELVRDLRHSGIKVGLATSSRNAAAILSATRTASLFETVVDGTVSEQLGLKGKPEPDIFTAAADNLGVAYGRAVVVEDAATGVRAGAAGGFGLVVGVARENNAEELRANGADVVVRDLAEASIDQIDRWILGRRSAGARPAGRPETKGRG